ncbi:MAG: hypothetical protein ACRYG5_03465 [Janthinobacterium lividum]
MKRIRCVAGITAVLGLAGCVAYPAGPYYSSGYAVDSGAYGGGYPAGGYVVEQEPAYVYGSPGWYGRPGPGYPRDYRGPRDDGYRGRGPDRDAGRPGAGRGPDGNGGGPRSGPGRGPDGNAGGRPGPGGNPGGGGPRPVGPSAGGRPAGGNGIGVPGSGRGPGDGFSAQQNR